LHVTLSATSENNWGVIRLIANLPFSRRFLRPPSTEAPSLHRSYPEAVKKHIQRSAGRLLC
jgi:hypothetical protein